MIPTVKEHFMTPSSTLEKIYPKKNWKRPLLMLTRYLKMTFPNYLTLLQPPGLILVQADLCIVMGSSLRVTPACEVPRVVSKHGKLIICK